VGQRHIDSAQRGKAKAYPDGAKLTLAKLYAIPPALVEDILRWSRIYYGGW
jgi:hypothetical protein